MRLNDVQNQFKDLMLDHPDALDTPDAEFAQQFESGRIPLPRRLKVYRNNIVGSLTDMLAAMFPLVQTLVGQEFFEGSARTFILQAPPEQGNLSLYGEGFDDFLRDFKPAQALPYLPDIAAFEIALNQAYYAPDQAPLTAEQLATIPPEQLIDACPKVSDYAKLIHSPYPLIAIRDFCDNGADGTLDMDQGGVHLMITRPNLSIDVVMLEADEFMMLSLLQHGKSLGQAVEAVIAEFPDFDFQNFLQKHLHLETFAALLSNSASNGE